MTIFEECHIKMYRLTTCEFKYRQSSGEISDVIGSCTVKWAAPIQIILLTLWFAYAILLILESYVLIDILLKFIPRNWFTNKKKEWGIFSCCCTSIQAEENQSHAKGQLISKQDC